MARIAGWLLVASVLVSCSEKTVHTEPGVSRELALQRAALISNIRYRLHFTIPADPEALVHGDAVISFDLAANEVPLQLDFRQDEANLLALRSNGEAIDCQFTDEHVVVPPAHLKTGRNTLEIQFNADPQSFNRTADYLYTLFVPDRARTAFPLFDQPDLKASFELSLEVPAHWQALSSAPQSIVDVIGESKRYRFAPSDPISSYLFSFVAGEFQSVAREVNGREMTLLHRETDEQKLSRNLEAIFELHGASLSWLEGYTGIDYPFQKFDFVLIPDFPYRGMEHVGAIQYRASSLLLDEAPAQTELLDRAQLIAHETAHMWFGDLVTMRWFDDVWTKEVFANFMADKIVNTGFPAINHELNFLVNHTPAAYAVDRSEGANPIRQQLPNLNEAGQMYGAIIYHKAPIMMRQLELIMGPEQFRQGLREYLAKFSYANASWPDLIAILDTRTEADLAAWSQVWVNTPGRPHFRLTPDEDGRPAGGTVLLEQYDAAGLGRIWPQQFAVAAIDVAANPAVAIPAKQITSSTVLSNGSPTPLEVPGTSGTGILYNADGYGYGLFPAELAVLESWEQLDDLQRGVALINVHDQVLAGSLRDTDTYFAQLLGILQRESNPLLLRLAMGQLGFVYHSLLSDKGRAARTRSTEEMLWNTLLAQPDAGRTRMFFRLFSALASSPAQLQKLHDIWSGQHSLHRLTLEEEDLIRLAQILAIRLPGQAEQIIGRQLANTENPDRRRRLEFVAPSLSADIAVRDAFFASLADPRMRETEAWVIEALGNLHHPSRLADSRKYLQPSLELLEEIQATGDIFFPSHWLAASLGNYHSASEVEIVRTFLASRPDYNRQLRMKILQAADPLFISARVGAPRSR